MTAPRHASGAGGSKPDAGVALAEPEAGAGRRLAVVASVLVLAVAGGLAGGLAGGNPPRTELPPAGLVAAAAPVNAESSSWYCAGSSGAKGPLGQSKVLLVNAGPRAVRARVDVAATKGRGGHQLVTVPARSQLAVSPAASASGPWLAARVDVSGGGVSASEMVDGSAGGAVAPCASETASTWYFAAGATTTGTSLRLSVFNPTANLAVVDLTFLTAAGMTAPQPFQGLVLRPDAYRSLTVGQYVQDQKQVAAVVSARSGAVVATELQTVQSGGITGVALRLGAPALARTWVLPRALDVSGGTSQVSVLNPSNRTESVSIQPRPSSGRVAAFTEKLGPHSVWTLDTAQEVRIPDAVYYAATVRATGGPGVVVDRTAAGGSGNAATRWGDDAAVPLVAGGHARWVVPAVLTPGTSTPAPRTIVLDDPGRQPVAALVSKLAASGIHRVARVVVKPGSFATVAPGTAAFLVTADGPLAVVGDASRAGAPATSLVPAIPQT